MIDFMIIILFGCFYGLGYFAGKAKGRHDIVKIILEDE